LRIEHGSLRAKQIGDAAHSCRIAVLSNAKTLFGFLDGGLGDLDALLGCPQIRVSPPNLHPDGGAGAILLSLAAAHQGLALFDSSLVAKTIEQIPAQPHGHKPVSAAPIVKSLPISLESPMEDDL